MLSFFIVSILSDDTNQINEMMKTRNYWNAYQLLNSMISKKEDSSLYRLRAICALHMTMPEDTIKDAEKILTINNTQSDTDFAYSLLARAYIQLGNLTLASQNAALSKSVSLINSVDALKLQLKSAKKLYKKKNYSLAQQHVDILLSSCPKSIEVRSLASSLAWIKKDYNKYAQIQKNSSPKSTTGIYRRAFSTFCSGNFVDAVEQFKSLPSNEKVENSEYTPSKILEMISEATKYYIEGQSALKTKEYEKSEINFENAVNLVLPVCSKTSNFILEVELNRIRSIILSGNIERAFEEFNLKIESDPNNTDAYRIERGSLLIKEKKYDEALEDFRYVKNKYQENKESEYYTKSLQGYGYTKQLRKQSQRVNYYEILGIPPNANPSQIKPAVQAATRKWHPDKFSDKQKKREAEEMMIKINKASEILQDPTKRHLYDNGIENPEDQLADVEDRDLFAVVYPDTNFKYGSSFKPQDHYVFDYTEEQEKNESNIKTSEEESINENL